MEAPRLLWGPSGTLLGPFGSPLDVFGTARRSFSAILGPLGRLFDQIMDFMKCMKNKRKTQVFGGFEASGRPSWSHLGPKVAPEGGRDGPKWPRRGRSEGSGR